MDRRLLDYIPELELPDFEAPRAADEDDELDDETEMALAAELLEVSGAAGLESYLADLVALVNPAGAAGVRTPLGQAVLGVLKRAVGPLLPVRAIGDTADLKRRAAALAQAARRHAPGLLAQAAQAPAQGATQGATQGRWQRQGNRIVVLDC